MAKQSGLGWTTFSVDDSGGTPVAIKNDITNLQCATPRGVQDVTGIDKSANERLLLLADVSYTLNGVVNTTVSHAVFKTVPSTSVARTVTNVISSQTLAAEVLFTDYNQTRATDGAWTWSAPGVLADGTVPAWS
ncbi:MAG TPA: hypothetical protein VGP26_24545 [Actinophytocola sp.]|jgi:hypothetical protein|nr:hypothetical protein [Actinophytocola sp.]